MPIYFGFTKMTFGSNETVHYKNDLRRFTAVIGAALALFGALLVVIVAYAGWQANRTAIVRERQLVENALDQSVSRVLDQQKAIAWWDDAVMAVTPRPNVEWLETNIGVFFYETYGHDEVIIVDGNNRPVYANVNGELSDARAAYAQHQAVLDPIVQEARSGSDNALRQRDTAFAESQGQLQRTAGRAVRPLGRAYHDG